MHTNFGHQLKHWRGLRRMSQMELGLEANVSARHISFLESGRAQPSSQMVVQLAQTLDVPRGARNHLLSAAGFANKYQARALDGVDMAPVRDAMEQMIAAHDPMPGFVLDRHWNIVSGNQGFARIAAMFDLSKGGSLLDALLALSDPKLVFENWAEFGWYILNRLRTENAHLGGDPVLEKAIVALAADVDIAGFRHLGLMPAIIPTRILVGPQVLSFISTIAQFGSTEDIVLNDLRIELLFPADAETAAFMKG